MCVAEILSLKCSMLERADQSVALEKLLEKSGFPVFAFKEDPSGVVHGVTRVRTGDVVPGLR